MPKLQVAWDRKKTSNRNVFGLMLDPKAVFDFCFGKGGNSGFLVNLFACNPQCYNLKNLYIESEPSELDKRHAAASVNPNDSYLVL